MRIPVENPLRKIENGPAGKRPARMRNAKSGSVGAKFIYNKREGGNQQDADPQVMENTHLEKEPEFSPEEMKAIKDTAHFIQEHRMSNDPERQKYWAKKYGLDENIFSEKNVKAILSGKGEWNDASEKFMQDWDWKTAKKAFRNMKKADAQASKPKMEDAVRRKAKENQGQINRKSAEDERIEDLEDNQLKRNMEFDAEQEQPVYGYKQGDEALAFSKDWKKKRYENVKPVEVSPENKNIELDPNDPNHAELIQAIADFEAKQSQIAEMRAKKGGRWASLRKTLGLKEKNLDTDPEVMVLEEAGKGLYRDLMAKGIHLYKGDKPQLENFLRQFDEFESFRNVRNQELDKKGEVAGFPENILAGLHTLTKKWSELGWKQKVAISVGGGLLFGGGAIALGAGTFGAASLGLVYRWGFRAFGAAAAGVGRNVMLDRQMMTEMQNEAEARLKERMDNIEKYEDNLDQGIEEMLNKSGISNIRKDFEQRRTANELRSLKFARNTFIISSIIGESLREVSQATGINVGSILSKIGEKTGISLAGVKETVGNFLSVSQANAEGGGMTGGSGGGVHGAYPEGKYGPGLYGTEGEGHGDIPKSTNERFGEGKYGPAGYGTENEGHGEITKSVDERYGHGRYGPSGHGTETEGHVNEFDEKYGPGKTGTENEGHVNEFDEKYGPGKTGTENEGHELVGSYPEGKYGPAGYGTENEGHGEITKSVDERYGHGRYSPSGHGTETEGHVNEFDEKYGPGKTGTENEGHVNEFDEKYGPGKTGTENEGHVNEFDEKYGPGKTGTENEGHVNEFDEKYGPEKTGTEAEGHLKDFEEVASGKFGRGGSFEGKIAQSIRANPAAFGLNPDDPNFSSDTQKMTRAISEEFSQRKGFSSYKEFDKYCRTHVQPGDKFEIIYNPNNEEIHINYEGKSFGPDVSPGAAGAVQEVAPSKPISHLEGGKLEPEDAVKPRTGAAHHPAKGAGKAMHYEGDTPDQKIAKEDFAKASDYQKAVREFNAKEAVRLEAVNEVANEQLRLSTSSGVKEIFYGSGVSLHTNILDKPMGSWNRLIASENYISQDPQDADVVKKMNLNLNKLKSLRPILERFYTGGSETIGECISRAVKDPKILYLINRTVL